MLNQNVNIHYFLLMKQDIVISDFSLGVPTVELSLWNHMCVALASVVWADQILHTYSKHRWQPLWCMVHSKQPILRLNTHSVSMLTSPGACGAVGSALDWRSKGLVFDPRRARPWIQGPSQSDGDTFFWVPTIHDLSTFFFCNAVAKFIVQPYRSAAATSGPWLSRYHWDTLVAASAELRHCPCPAGGGHCCSCVQQLQQSRLLFPSLTLRICWMNVGNVHKP
jgi:hypothetical protein